MRRPVVASSSPRSIRSQRGSTLERRAHRHRTVPTCWRAREVPICHLLGEECTALRARQEPEHRVFAIFSTFRDTARWLANGERSCGSWRRRRAVRSSGQTGTDRVGWCACPWLTLFATEWSAARKNPLRAVAMHFSAAISADVKARRILTSGRREFPSGNSRSARDLEGAKRVSRGQAHRRPQQSPFARKTAPHASAPQPLSPVPVCYNKMRNVPIYARVESSARAAWGLRTFAPLMKYRNTSPERARACARSRQRASAAGA